MQAVTHSLPARGLGRDGATAYDRFGRGMVYTYFFLLVFEGALRKWVLPGLSTPLLIVRDPLAALIILNHLLSGRHLLNAYTLPVLFLGTVSFLFTLGLGHGNLPIAVFGLRTLVLHFFLVFIIGQLLDRRDVEAIGRTIVYLLPAITVLMALQFYSPQSAWVNRGVGGDMEGAGFSGAMGFFRPSGPFSFTTGLVNFYGLAAAYVFYFWGAGRRVNRLMLMVATACLLIAIPLSLSRSYLFQFLITGLFFAIASLRNPRATGTLLWIVVLTPVLGLLLLNFSFMQTAIEALTARFDLAAKSEGGLEGTLGDRFLGGLLRAVTDADGAPWHGFGLGLGTNVGSVLLTGEAVFLIAEGEWGRIVGEMGLPLGLPVILLRIVLALHLLLRSVGQLLRDEALPFMLLSFGLLMIVQGGWSTPTSLGFFAAVTGLIVASLRVPYARAHAA